MLQGHGDDTYLYPDIQLNFSSNVYCHFDHTGLYAHLAGHLDVVESYPEPDAAHLEALIAEHLGLHASKVLATAGATEAIYLVAQAFSGAHSTILQPTFAEYADACRLNKHHIIHNDLTSFAHSPLSLSPLSHGRGVGGEACLLWLCCPNNPTGTVFPREQLLSTIDTHPQTIFVIDASYAPFTRAPLITPAEAAERTNVIMLHSMTKRFAVPGLRLGYVTANALLLKRLRAQQRPWSIDALAQKAATYLFTHAEDYTIPLDLLLSERSRMATALTTLGIDVHPSDTHILLCRLRQGSKVCSALCPPRFPNTAAELKNRLARQHGILIRDASNFHGLTSAHFRIAAQLPKDNDALLHALDNY